MKRINKHNALLSKLPFWRSCGGFLFSLLLLLLLVSACSDEGREMAEIQQGADEVELTIRTEISGMKNNARTTITDAVNSIVALAFDESDALIKKVDAVLTKEENSTSGTLKIKVPKRTRSIHFLGNYTKNDITDITTIDDLKALTTDDMTTMHYWGTTTFDGSNANLPVILYRNMAKVTLTLGNDLTGYIAGFVNYNTTGTVVPNGFTVGDTPTIPTEVDTNTHQEDNSLDTEHYLFEHPNVEDTNPLFVIVEILDKYYKVAFATKANDVLTYFPIVRNRAYNITINSVEESLGGTYKEALAADPINDVVIEEKTVTILAVPSASTLNYATNSVEDLLVNVTIPKEVTKLTFTSSDFTIKVASGELVAVENKENSYTITHDENATETTVPVRIRLNDNVSSQTASFTFSGTSDDENVTVQEDTESITLAPDDDENVRWQGSVPLNENDSTMVPLLYNWFCESGNNKIDVDSRLKIEFEVTDNSESYFEITEIRGSSSEWNNPAFSFPELSGYKYDAITSGEGPVIVTMNQSVFDIILANYRTTFLGDTDVAMAIRGKGITLTKVSILPPEETTTSNILITTPDATEGVSEASVDISYSNSSAIEEYTITVTVPDGVTELNYTNNGFSNVYIDSDNGWYNDAQSPITISDNKSIPLRLRVDKNNSNPSISFSADGAESASFTVNRTAGTTNSDVLWEGALLFQGYDVHVSKIDIPNSSLQGKLLDGAVLTLEYEVVDDSNDFISLYGSGVSNWANLENMADAGEYTDNNTSTITLTLNAAIIENIGNSSLNMQGRGRVLKKVTLTAPTNVTFDVLEETISLDLATNEAVLHVQKPANVTQLTITDNDNLFGTVSTTFANANVDVKTISNLPNYAATIPVKLEITQVVDIKNYTITVAGNDGSSDNVTVELLTTWSGSHSLGNWEGYWRTARKLPVGTTVQITFADYDNCSFELHTYSATDNGNDIRFEAYSVDNDEYIPSSNLINGVFSFTVATDGSVQIRNNGNFNNVTDSGLDGLQINGGDGLSVTQVNVTLGSGGTTTPTGFTYTFEDGVKFGEWNNNITTDIVYDDTLGSNVLKMVVSENNDKFGQIGISNGDYSGSYTLSIKYRAESSTGKMNLVFQDEDNSYAERGKRVEGDINDEDNDNDVLSTSWKTITWDLTLSGHADQFVIQFENVEANATFYIDDLKLVKND